MSDVSEPIESKEEKEDITSEMEREAWGLLSDVDPVTGLKYSWLDIREVLMTQGVASALPLMFEYYLDVNGAMDPYMNYMIACSHFTPEELGHPATKNARRRLQLKMRKLLAKKKDSDGLHRFMQENGRLD